MNRAVIFLNGDCADLTHIKSYIDSKTLLIGCDGGSKHITALGYKPYAIVGDFDSFDKSLLREDIEIIEHPEDKDYTDSEAAIRYAIKQGAGEVILVALLGRRVDHMLGNIYLLNKQDFVGIKLKIIEGNQEIYMITGKVIIKGKKGDAISFIPVFGDVKAEFSSGLKYDLAKYTLSLQGNTGISNEMISDMAEIDLENQKLVVIHSRD